MGYKRTKIGTMNEKTLPVRRPVIYSIPCDLKTNETKENVIDSSILVSGPRFVYGSDAERI